jgi:hypothetical protein
MAEKKLPPKNAKTNFSDKNKETSPKQDDKYIQARIKQEDDHYLVESSSEKGKFYKVDPKKPWCDCPRYRFFEMAKKGVCKHIKLVRQEFAKETIGTTDEVKKFLADGEKDSIVVIEKFGEETINQLISNGDIIEKNGKLRLLE